MSSAPTCQARNSFWENADLSYLSMVSLILPPKPVKIRVKGLPRYYNQPHQYRTSVNKHKTTHRYSRVEGKSNGAVDRRRCEQSADLFQSSNEQPFSAARESSKWTALVNTTTNRMRADFANIQRLNIFLTSSY